MKIHHESQLEKLVKIYFYSYNLTANKHAAVET